MQGLELPLEISAIMKDVDACIVDQINNLPGEIPDILLKSSNRGKRVRALLLILCGINAGSTGKNLIPAAAAIELIHYATLIHDDLVDSHHIRRGFPSIPSIVPSETAVLIADCLLTSSLVIISKASNSAVKSVIHSLHMISDSELKAHLGILGRTFSKEDYLTWIKGKTGSLFISCAVCGAVIGGAGKDQMDLFEQLGENIGISFQIENDILDYSDKYMHKPTGSDLEMGKVTLPLIYYMEKVGVTPLLKRWIEGLHDPQTIHELSRMVYETGAVDNAHEEAIRYAKVAINLANKLPSKIKRNLLIDLCNYLVERTE